MATAEQLEIAANAWNVLNKRARDVYWSYPQTTSYFNALLGVFQRLSPGGTPLFKTVGQVYAEGIPPGSSWVELQNGTLSYEAYGRALQALFNGVNDIEKMAKLEPTIFERFWREVVAQTYQETKKAITSPTEWPWWLQAGIAGVGLFYASQIWANFRGKK